MSLSTSKTNLVLSTLLRRLKASSTVGSTVNIIKNIKQNPLQAAIAR
jgi:hypothetical protein